MRMTNALAGLWRRARNKTIATALTVKRRVRSTPNEAGYWAKRAPADPAWDAFLKACAQGASIAPLKEGIERGWHRIAWVSEGDAFDNRYSALHLSALADDDFALKALIRAGASLETLCRHGFTALGVAARAGRVGAMATLLGAGAQPWPQKGMSALAAAAQAGQIEAVDWLLDRIDIGGGAKRARRLNGALAEACLAEPCAGRLACARRLMEWGANPNKAILSGTPCLLWPSAQGDSELVELLLRSGADPRARRAHDGADAFMWAAQSRRGDLTTPMLLRRHGANLSRCRKDGKTSLMFAAEGGNLECLESALEAGGGVHDRDQKGSSALHFAALSGSLDCVRRLLLEGADPSAADKEGITPMWRAAQIRNEEIFQELVLAGGDPLGGFSFVRDRGIEMSERERDKLAFSMALKNGWGEALSLTWDRGLAWRREAGEQGRILALERALNPDGRHLFSVQQERDALSEALPPGRESERSSRL